MISMRLVELVIDTVGAVAKADPIRRPCTIETVCEWATALKARRPRLFRFTAAAGQFPRRQRGLIQRQVDDAFANIIRNAVPDAIRLRMSVVQSFRPTGLVQIVPTVEGGARNADLF